VSAILPSSTDYTKMNDTRTIEHFGLMGTYAYMYNCTIQP